MMLRTSNYRKPSKPPGSDSNEPSGGLVRSAGCSGKKDGQSYMMVLVGESSVVGSMALHSVRSRDEPCGRPGSRSIRDHCFVWDLNPTKNLLYGALRWWRSKPTNMPAPGRWWVGAFIGPSEPVLGRALDFWINKRVLPDVRPRGVLSYPLVLLGNWSDNPFARPRAGRGKHHAIAVM